MVLERLYCCKSMRLFDCSVYTDDLVEIIKERAADLVFRLFMVSFIYALSLIH